MVHPLATEKIWFDKARVEEAESNYYARKYSGSSAATPASSALLADIKNIKNHIRNALGADSDSDLDLERLAKLEKETAALRQLMYKLEARIAALEGDSSYLDDEIDMQRLERLENENDALRGLISRLESRVTNLEAGATSTAAPPKPAAAPAADDDDDDDIDLFGSDDEGDAEAEKIKQERLAAYAAKKSKKPALVAKSNIIMDIKPWDDETDLAEMEKCVRSIAMDGLLWGSAKLVPVGYGIRKLQISCVVEDDKVGTDDLEDKICAFEDYVQSMDVAAFNKI